MVFGGLFDHVNAKINQLDYDINISCLGLDEFPQCGNPLEILDFHGLNCFNISKQIAKDNNVKLKANINVNIKDYSEAPQ